MLLTARATAGRFFQFGLNRARPDVLHAGSAAWAGVERAAARNLSQR